MTFLIDTDIFVDELRGNKDAADFFIGLQSDELSGITSVITIAELFAGKDCNTKEGLNAVEKILELVSIENVSEIVAKKAGELKRKYNIATTDAIIAATAIQNNLTLLTRNVKDFNKIKEIRIKIPY